MAYTWHLTVSSYRARSRLPARFFSPLHFFRLYYYVGPFLAFSSVDSTKRVTETTCVVFTNAKRRNNVIANFRAFLRIFRERVGKGEERRERVGDRERFLQNRKSPGQPSNPATQRPQRALLRPCLGSIDRDRIVSLLPFHSAAFPANPFFCSMHIYV